jgi:hypothetical protein
MPCDYCGEAEVDHVCRESWRWIEPIPLETEELVRYLATVWGIRNAELVAIETGPYAVRDALLIVWRGSKDGRRYTDPSGLIVKLARRLANAADRAKRRRG